MEQGIRQEIAILHAQICHALADPSRLLILFTLARKPKCVNDLSAELGLSQPSVSRHLRVLRERALVTAERQGTAVYYSLTDPRILQALDLLRDIVRDHAVHQADLARNARGGQ